MVLQAVGGAGAGHEVECLPQPPHEKRRTSLLVLFGEGREERCGVRRILPALGDRIDLLIVDAPPLPGHIKPLARQGGHPDEKHPDFDILDPVARQVADNQRVGNDFIVDQLEEAAGDRDAPHERRADQRGSEGIDSRHGAAPPTTWPGCAPAHSAGTLSGIGSPCPAG